MVGNRMKFWAIVAIAAIWTSVSVGIPIQAEAADKPIEVKKETAPKIQMAILLDTSNSMDGLINQARTQLWKIVSEFAQTKLAGLEPTLEVGLYEYGNSGLPAKEGYVRLVVPLTSDLDKVSEALHALTTNGGSEYCGKVISMATQELDWTDVSRDLRCIFIAGNESFAQGGVDYRQACKSAATKGITISTIFCGNRQEGIQTNWEDGAKLADGSYLCINQDRAVATPLAPQDQELAKLSAQLNETYVTYGKEKERLARAALQVKQDANAAKSTIASAASRAAFKASKLYRNANWDLVDAVADGRVKLETLAVDQLPKVMQTQSLDERKAYIASKAQQRKTIQAKIQNLSTKRNTYVAKEKKMLRMKAITAAKAAGLPEPAAPAPDFSEAVIEAVQQQAAEK